MVLELLKIGPSQKSNPITIFITRILVLNVTIVYFHGVHVMTSIPQTENNIPVHAKHETMQKYKNVPSDDVILLK